MASLSSIRDGLKANLGAIEGLRVYDIIPDQINVPAAIVGGPERITFDLTAGRGADTFLIPVRVYASRSDERAGQDKLDGYLATTGATSIKAAIESDSTLGDAAHTLRVTEARGYGAYQVGGVTYLGVEFLVEVIA